MTEPTMNALVSPEGSLEILSTHEVNRLKDKSEGGLYACSVSVHWPCSIPASKPTTVRN